MWSLWDTEVAIKVDRSCSNKVQKRSIKVVRRCSNIVQARGIADARIFYRHDASRSVMVDHYAEV
jgi:hypothetical protein